MTIPEITHILKKTEKIITNEDGLIGIWKEAVMIFLLGIIPEFACMDLSRSRTTHFRMAGIMVNIQAR